MECRSLLLGGEAAGQYLRTGQPIRHVAQDADQSGPGIRDRRVYCWRENDQLVTEFPFATSPRPITVSARVERLGRIRRWRLPRSGGPAMAAVGGVARRCQARRERGPTLPTWMARGQRSVSVGLPHGWQNDRRLC